MVQRFAPSHWRRGRGGRGRLTVPRRAIFPDTPAESARGRGSRRGRCPPHGSQGGYRGGAFAPGAGWPWTARGSALSRFSDTPAVSVRGHGNRRGRCRLRGSRCGCGGRFCAGGRVAVDGSRFRAEPFFRHTSCICPRPWKPQGAMLPRVSRGGYIERDFAPGGGCGWFTASRRAIFPDTPAVSARGRGNRRGRCPPRGSRDACRGRGRGR